MSSIFSRWQSLFSTIAMLALASASADPALGQRAAKPKTKKGKGKIVAIAPNAIQIQDLNKGELWVIAPVAASQIEFIAEAKSDWIDRGMVARVTGTFDKKGVATEPIKLVQVFTPRPDYPMGAIWQGTGKPKRDTPQEFLVAGIIKRINEGNVTIDAGKRQFTFEVAEDAKIEVDLLNDLDWIQQDDKIQFNLKYYTPGTGMIAWAKIEAATELMAPERKPRRQRKSRRRRTKEAEAIQSTTGELGESAESHTDENLADEKSKAAEESDSEPASDHSPSKDDPE